MLTKLQTTTIVSHSDIRQTNSSLLLLNLRKKPTTMAEAVDAVLTSAALEEHRALLLVNRKPNPSKWLKIKLDVPTPAVAPAVAPVVAPADGNVDNPPNNDGDNGDAAAVAPVDIVPVRTGLKKKSFILVSKDNCDLKHWPEMILRAVKEFISFHKMYNLTPAALFSYFRETMEGAAGDQWDVEAENAEITFDGFNETLEKWTCFYVEESKKPDQIQYLKAFRNNGRMSVEDCVSRLATINNLMKFWGTEESAVPFDTEAFKVLVFETTMTPAWRIEFQSQGKSLSSEEMTLKALLKFMKIEEAKDQAKKILETPIARKSRKKREGLQKLETKVKKQRIGYSGSGNCRYHPGHHDWKDCFGNKNGPNFKETYVLPPLPENRKNQRGKKSWNKKKSESTEDANFMDVDEPQGDTKQQIVRFLTKCDPEFSKLDDKAKAVVRNWMAPKTAPNKDEQPENVEEHYFDALSKSEDISSGIEVLDISED